MYELAVSKHAILHLIRLRPRRERMSGVELEFEFLILSLGLSDVGPVKVVYILDSLHLYRPLACPVFYELRLPNVTRLLLTIGLDDLKESL